MGMETQLPSSETARSDKDRTTARAAAGQNRSHTDKQRARRKLRFTAGVATLGALSFGYDTGIIAGALPFMVLPASQGGLDLTPTTEGLVTASLLFGAAFGAVGGGRLSDRWGRRHNLRLLALIFALGALGTALAPNVTFMVCARIILGFGVGGASATVPMYLAEIAPAKTRGPLVSYNELMIVTGQLLAYTTNAALAAWGDPFHAWRWMLGLAALPATLLWIGTHFIPESPRWLVRKERFTEAQNVLNSVRTTETDTELMEIKKVVEESRNLGNPWEALKTPWIKRITLIGIGFGIVIQLSGINAIMYFAPTVLITTGLGAQQAITMTIANGVISVLAVAIGLNLLRFMSRRKMLMTGMTGLIVSQIIMSVLFQAPDTPVKGFTILACMLAFLFFFQTFCAVVFWLMMSEIFPLRVRGLAMGIAVFCQWMSNMLVTFFFPILLHAVQGYVFLIFAGVNLIVLLFEWKFLPETAGKSLEELEYELASGSDGRGKVVRA